jgi:hypothetical protein
LVEVFDRITRDADGRVAYHFVLVDFLFEPVAGETQAGDDVDAVAWVGRSRVGDYPTTDGAGAVIEKAFAMRDARGSVY